MSAPAHTMGLVTSEAEMILSADICQEKLLEVVLRRKLCWQTSNTRPKRYQLGWGVIKKWKIPLWSFIVMRSEESRPPGPLEMFIKDKRWKIPTTGSEWNVICATCKRLDTNKWRPGVTREKNHKIFTVISYSLWCTRGGAVNLYICNGCLQCSLDCQLWQMCPCSCHHLDW